MKITVNLTPAEVAGLKKYLAEVSPDIYPKISKEDIAAEIQGIVSSCLQSGAVSDYINNEPKY